MRRYLSVGEVANLLGFSVGTVYQYTSRSQIPHYKVGGRLLFDEPEIREWLQLHKQPTGETNEQFH